MKNYKELLKASDPSSANPQDEDRGGLALWAVIIAGGLIIGGIAVAIGLSFIIEAILNF